MKQTNTYQSITVHRQYDPTNTLTLRNAFQRDMDRRFNELAYVIRKAVDEQDCFGLRRLQTHQMNLSGQGAFDFPRSEVKMAQFMKWLEEQIKLGKIKKNP